MKISSTYVAHGQQAFVEEEQDTQKGEQTSEAGEPDTDFCQPISSQWSNDRIAASQMVLLQSVLPQNAASCREQSGNHTFSVVHSVLSVRSKGPEVRLARYDEDEFDCANSFELLKNMSPCGGVQTNISCGALQVELHYPNFDDGRDVTACCVHTQVATVAAGRYFTNAGWPHPGCIQFKSTPHTRVRGV